MTDRTGEEIEEELVDYFNFLAQLAGQGLLVPEVRGLVLISTEDPDLTAELELDLFKRREAGLFAEDQLAHAEDQTDEDIANYEYIRDDGRQACELLVRAFDFLAVAHALKSLNGMAGLDAELQRSRAAVVSALEAFDYIQGEPFGYAVAEALEASAQ